MKKYIPDCITLMNLLCGACACVLASEGRYFDAFLLIAAAACFDFCDGFAARLLHAYSDLGKELDSLCDLVSFGLAPALMLFNWYSCGSCHPQRLAWITMLLPLAAALRLARFNTDTSAGSDFKGLAVPGAALIIAPLVAFVHISSIENGGSREGAFLFDLLATTWFIPVLSAVVSLLMVSRIPMFSMKHKKLSFRKFPLFSYFICGFVFIALILQCRDTVNPTGSGFFHFTFPLALCFGLTLYVLVNIIALPFSKTKNR